MENPQVSHSTIYDGKFSASPSPLSTNNSNYAPKASVVATGPPRLDTQSNTPTHLPYNGEFTSIENTPSVVLRPNSATQDKLPYDGRFTPISQQFI